MTNAEYIMKYAELVNVGKNEVEGKIYEMYVFPENGIAYEITFDMETNEVLEVELQ